MERILKILIKPDTGKISGIVIITVAMLIWPPANMEAYGAIGVALGALSHAAGQGGKNG
jgi:putative effector of murein hydrolase